MKKKCFACDVEKDLNEPVRYPYHEKDGPWNNRPVRPLFCIGCQDEEGFRIGVLCHDCYHCLLKNGAGIWIVQREWESLNPVRSFNSLPERKEHLQYLEVWNPENYE